MMNSLPAPTPPRERLSLLQFLGTLQDNAIGIFTEEAYEKELVQRKVLGRKRVYRKRSSVDQACDAGQCREL